MGTLTVCVSYGIHAGAAAKKRLEYIGDDFIVRFPCIDGVNK